MSDSLPTSASSEDETNPSGTFVWGESAEVHSNDFAFLDPAENPDELGRLGGYRVLRLLGQGGMGIVFLAEDPGLERLVGLKVMRPEAATSPKARERFLREARSVATIRCDHVVTIYQVGESKGLPFLAMELLKGVTLATWLKGQAERPPTLAVIKVAKDVLRGLAAAHEKGLIHRDIKPSNLWVETATNRIKVLDFGLAWHDGTDARLTRDGELLGTPAFMAPEQARGQPVDCRTDLFSLGAVLYRMLAGHAPYERGSLIATLTALGTLSASPLPLDVPPELRDWIGRLLARDPAWRPASATEALAEVSALERLFKQQRSSSSGHEVPIQAPPTVIEPQPPQPVPPTPTPRLTPAHVPGSDSRHPWPIRVAIAIGILVFVGYVGVLLTNRHSSGPRVKRPTGGPSRLVENARPAVVLPPPTPLISDPAPAPAPDPVPAPVSVPAPEPTPTIAEVGPPAELAASARPVPSSPKPKPTPTPTLSGPAAIPITLPDAMALPDLVPFGFEPTPAGKSPFDPLDARSIPSDERFGWQPRELVAVVGSHARRHWGPGVSIAISPDGRWAASTAQTAFEPIVVWDMLNQRPRAYLADGGAGLIGFTAESRHLVFVTGNEVVVYDLANPRVRNALGKLAADGKVPPQMVSVGLCEGGRTLVVANWHQDQLVLFDLRGAKPVLSDRRPMMKPQAGVTPALVAADGNRVVYRGRGGGFQRANVRDGRFEDNQTLEVPHDPGSRSFGLSPRGDRLVVWQKGRAVVWNLSGPNPLRIGTLPEEGLTPGSRLSISADGRWLASKTTATRLYRLDGDSPAAVDWLDQTDTIGGGAVAFSSDSDRAALVNGEGFVRFWDLSKATPTELSPLDPDLAFPTIANQAFSPIDATEGRLVVPRYDGPQGQVSGRFAFWSLAGKRPELVPGSPGLLDLESAGQVYPIGPGRSLSVQTRPPAVRFHSLQEGRWTTEPEPALPSADHHAWAIPSPDFHGLLTTSQGNDRQLSFWEIHSGPARRLWTIALDDRALPSPTATRVVLSADGRLLATAFPARGEFGGELILWQDPESDHPSPAARIPIALGAGAMAGYCLALSPDGRLLAHNPDESHELVCLDLSGSNPRIAGRFRVPELTSGLRSLAFSPDARKVAWAGERAAGVIDLTTGKPVWVWSTPGKTDWVGFAPDGRHLFLHNANKTYYVLRFSSWGRTPITAESRPGRPRRPGSSD